MRVFLPPRSRNVLEFNAQRKHGLREESECGNVEGY